MPRPSYVPDDAENVADHGGALGNVSLGQAVDNAEAISAAASASSSNSVYIPSGEYYIGTSGFKTLGIGGSDPKGISFYGAGPEKTFLNVHPDHADDDQPEIWYEGDVDHGDVTWRGLTYDGKRKEGPGYDTGKGGRSRGINIKEGDFDMFTFKNVRIRHFTHAAVHSGGGATLSMLVKNCTVRDIAMGLLEVADGKYLNHMFSGSGTVKAGEKFTFEDSKFLTVAGNVIDTNSPGEVEFNNCYAAGTGDAFAKIDEIGTLALNNVYFQAQTEELLAEGGDEYDWRGHYFFKRMDGDTSLTPEVVCNDVVACETSIAAVEARSDRSLALSGGKSGPIALQGITYDPDKDNQKEGFHENTNSSSISFDVGEMSFHDSFETIFKMDRGGGTIETLNHGGTAGLGDYNGLSINNENAGGDQFQPVVPSRDEVGINTGDNSDGEDTELDDSEDDEPTEPLFEDWTPRWTSDESDWSVVSGESYTGGYALAFEHASDERSRRALSFDRLGTLADVEVLDKFRVPAFTDQDGLGFHARMNLRASGSAGSENGYWIEIEDRAESFRLGKYTDGSLTTLAQFGTPQENTFFYRRFRAEGEKLKAKVWPATEAEPADWDVELTDGDHAEGWVGPGSFDTALVETDIFTVAQNGETAPISDANRVVPPTVSWKSPTDGETVSGTTTVQIDASDATDGDNPLTVEYRLDDNSWTEATLNSETGYYEGALDLSAFSAGDHTLEAEATDSEGVSASAAIDVTVEETTDDTTDATALGIDEFEVSDWSGDTWSRFVVDWSVSHESGDLDTVVTNLRYEGATVAAKSTSISGDQESFSHALRVRGDVDEVRLLVNDTENNVISETKEV